MLKRIVLIAISIAAALCAQKPGDAELNQAYQALAQKNYDLAI